MAKTTKQIDADDEGNNLPVPPADSDIGQLIYLLEYGRQRGFRIGPTVQIGNVIVQVSDLRQHEGRAQSETPEPTIWQQNGHDE